MNEISILKRRIVLKKKALRLFVEEIRGWEERLALLKIKQRIEGKIKANFDPEASRRLDAVNFLLEEGSDRG